VPSFSGTFLPSEDAGIPQSGNGNKPFSEGLILIGQRSKCAGERARVENRPVIREQRRPQLLRGILTAGGVMSGNSPLNVAEIRREMKLALNRLDITQIRLETKFIKIM